MLCDFDNLNFSNLVIIILSLFCLLLFPVILQKVDVR